MSVELAVNYCRTHLSFVQESQFVLNCDIRMDCFVLETVIATALVLSYVADAAVMKHSAVAFALLQAAVVTAFILLAVLRRWSRC